MARGPRFLERLTEQESELVIKARGNVRYGFREFNEARDHRDAWRGVTKDSFYYSKLHYLWQTAEENFTRALKALKELSESTIDDGVRAEALRSIRRIDSMRGRVKEAASLVGKVRTSEVTPQRRYL